MLTTSPYLHIRRPSPTTAEFSVSTLPPLTLPLRIIHHLVNGLRVLFGISVLLLLYSKWTLSPYSTRFDPTCAAPALLSEDIVWFAVQKLQHSPPGRFFLALADAAPGWLLIPTAFASLYCVLLRVHTEERLLVLRGLGIQTSSSAATVLGGAVTRFIPTEKIRDVLVNEAFRGFEVRYYLVVVVEDEEDVVVVFPKLLPRRDVVEQVWRGVRGCLFEEKGGGGKDKDSRLRTFG